MVSYRYKVSVYDWMINESGLSGDKLLIMAFFYGDCHLREDQGYTYSIATVDEIAELLNIEQEAAHKHIDDLVNYTKYLKRTLRNGVLTYDVTYSFFDLKRIYEDTLSCNRRAKTKKAEEAK